MFPLQVADTLVRQVGGKLHDLPAHLSVHVPTTQAPVPPPASVQLLLAKARVVYEQIPVLLLQVDETLV